MIGTSNGEFFDDEFGHMLAALSRYKEIKPPEQPYAGNRKEFPVGGDAKDDAGLTRPAIPPAEYLDSQGYSPNADQWMERLPPYNGPKNIVPDEVKTESVMNMLRGWVGASKEFDTEPTKDVSPNTALQGYPTREHANFAKEAGMGYGTRAEPFINEEMARVLSTTQTFKGEGGRAKDRGKTYVNTFAAGADEVPTANNTLRALMNELASPKYSKLVDVNDQLKEQLQGRYGRAALAVDRIPIAGLGFDPSKVIADVFNTRQDLRVSVYGAYDPSKDFIYSNLGSVGNMVHESIHRGIEKLRSNPEAKKIIDSLPDEEYIVRWLMYKYAGDPEVEPTGKRHPQADAAISYFGTGIQAGVNQTKLEELNKIAQDMIKKRQPMGPR